MELTFLTLSNFSKEPTHEIPNKCLTLLLCFCSILMKGITWSRDSHGLFDYESRHLTKKTLKAEKPVIITRSTNDLSLLHYSENESFQDQMNAQSTTDLKGLLKIVNRNNTFYLESAAYQHHERDLAFVKEQGGMKCLNQEQMFLVVRSLKHNNEKIVSSQPYKLLELR